MSGNPYQPPSNTELGTASDGKPSNQGKVPFSLQAAKFSLYAPFIVFLISCCASRPGFEENPDLRSQIGFAIGLIVWVTTLAAFGLGIVGVIGGIKRRATGTIAIAVLGILLNSALIVSAVALFVQLRNLTS